MHILYRHNFKFPIIIYIYEKTIMNDKIKWEDTDANNICKEKKVCVI